MCCIDQLNSQTKAVAGKKGLSAIRAQMESIVPISNEQKQEWRIRLQFWCMASLDKDLQKEQSHRYRHSKERFQLYLQESKELGELKKNITVDTEANKMTHMIAGLSVATLHSPHYFNKPRLLDTIDDYISDLRKK